jgi:hypothetical protein
MTSTVPKEVLDSYVTLLQNLDDKARAYILKKIKVKPIIKNPGKKDLLSLAGAWDDPRSSDEIIKDIRDSRVEKEDIKLFE